MKSLILKSGTLTIIFGAAALSPALAQEIEVSPAEDAEGSAIAEETDDFVASLGIVSDDPLFEARRHKRNKDRSHLRNKIKEECGKVALTDDQKAALKDSAIAYKREMITLKAEHKVAKLDYVVSLAKTDTVRADADTAGTSLTDSATRISSRKVDFTNDVFFDILTAEQRPAALKCLMLVKKAHGRHGHR